MYSVHSQVVKGNLYLSLNYRHSHVCSVQSHVMKSHAFLFKYYSTGEIHLQK